jgi:PAS domain S-box-containing protein
MRALEVTALTIYLLLQRRGEFMAQAGRKSTSGRRTALNVGAREVDCERAWLAAIVDFCSDAILSKTLDGTITSWNAAAERMYGYSAAEAIGRSIELIVPEDRRDELNGMDERLARGERVPPFETVRLTKDRRRIDVALTMSPIIDHAGTVVGASGIGRDVSERRRADEALRRSQGQLKDFVKNSALGLQWVGPDGIVLWANQAHLDLLGYAREEYIGRHSPNSTPTRPRSENSSIAFTAMSNSTTTRPACAARTARSGMC